MEPNAAAEVAALDLERERTNGAPYAVVHAEPSWHDIIIAHLLINGHASANVLSVGKYILVKFPENCL